MSFSFKLSSQTGRARSGRLATPRGEVQTPAFVPVGTQATVKSLTPQDLKNVGTQMVLANSYHLYLQPGREAIEALGGLHRMMAWNRPLMTDSGGFQVFSLGWALEHDVGKLVSLFADDSREEIALKTKTSAQEKSIVRKPKLCVVDDQGATFLSHLDGSLHRWTPEKSIELQKVFGADLVFALDECTSPVHDQSYTKQSTQRSHQWEERSLEHFNKLNRDRTQAIYGIVQGGPFEVLRKQSAKFIADRHFFASGIGGALVDKLSLNRILDWIMPILPENRPNHLLGIGDIDDIFAGVERGIDSFDCAHPTRIARRGDLLMLPEDGGSRTNHWRLQVTRQEFRHDPKPVSRACPCELCSSGYSRGYLNHLFWAKELLAFRLSTVHNLGVMHRLMTEIREGIASKRLKPVKERWLG